MRRADRRAASDSRTVSRKLSGPTGPSPAVPVPELVPRRFERREEVERDFAVYRFESGGQAEESRQSRGRGTGDPDRTGPLVGSRRVVADGRGLAVQPAE